MPKIRFVAVAACFGACLCCLEGSNSQGQQPPPPPSPGQFPAPAVPNGVDVQARGPVHEAFAAPTNEAQPSPIIRKQPPVPLNEMPPEERPEGAAVWISGYYHYDDDRQDFLWVSGCWRVRPEGREWVPGYWREENGGWQWVAGFWAVAPGGTKTEVVYQPAPPPPPNVAPPGDPPRAGAFYVPGSYVLVGGAYAWRAGFWTQAQPGFVWIQDHYRWTWRGYVFIPGHWDLIPARRGLLYCPVVVSVGPGFVYTPAYAVDPVFLVDAMFIRPAYCHFYFGDYYGPRYVGFGFESCLFYSRRFYDPCVVYMRWNNPGWFNLQIGIYNNRFAGRDLPPRRLAEVGGRGGFVGPGRGIIAAHGGRAVGLSHQERIQHRNNPHPPQQHPGAKGNTAHPPHPAPPHKK